MDNACWCCGHTGKDVHQGSLGSWLCSFCGGTLVGNVFDQAQPGTLSAPATSGQLAQFVGQLYWKLAELITKENDANSNQK